ncbi:hypothetical protein KIW84_040458 [Lathyrus oleraceus]|uniref:Uncharacterized protein n=1 Tax=Pisum sativum TaxID=3888 RepID=A0A9D5AQ40_PEA|nr:hypothetical protein KIW84_040458 [Pisum sativum]
MPGEEAPKGPFPIRPPTGTRRPALAAGAAQAVHQQPTGSELGPPCPALRANPFPDRAWKALGPPDFQGPPGAHRTPCDVSAQLGTVTQLPVHPASPVLLTKNGPLGALDSTNSPSGSSYPEGNFGGNQLLDGSISLSPLYPSQTNDLHVSIAAGLHQSFLWLRPAQA